MNHSWPKDEEHLWSPWYPETGPPKATQYRNCLHPACHAKESREAPKAP